MEEEEGGIIRRRGALTNSNLKMMETRAQPLAFEKRLWQADRGNFSTLLPRIGEISSVIWKLPFSEITGYIKARPWLELMITTSTIQL